MASDRKELIELLRRLAAKTKDAERERTLLSLVERFEAGEDVLDEIEQLPLVKEGSQLLGELWTEAADS
jgi:hypothetical protein